MIETISVTIPAPALRLVVGGAAAAAVALAARRARALSTSGSVAAVACGAASAAAGWAWAALLVTYFVASSLVSAAGRARKEARTAPVAEKGSERDAAQVLANGGVFVIAALATVLLPIPYAADVVACAAAGALAASAADTWGTEVGVVSGGVPRSIITGTPVRVGESGGVTWTGTLGGAAGAAFVAGIAALLGLARGAPLAPLVAGMIGSVVDSMLGATLQARRRCDACGTLTERAVHDCGAETRPARGVRWIDNDVVNLAATVAGFVVAGALGAWWLHG